MKHIAENCKLVNIGVDLEGQRLFARVYTNAFENYGDIKPVLEKTVSVTPTLYKMLENEDRLTKLRKVYNFWSSNDTDVADKVTTTDRPSGTGSVMMEKKEREKLAESVITVSFIGPNTRISSSNPALLTQAEASLAGKTLPEIIAMQQLAGLHIGEKTISPDGSVRLQLS